jgi:dihydroorotase (multifunctional complex type)
MAMDIVIRNGKVVTPQGIIEGGVAIEGERIAMIAQDSFLPEAARVIDAQGNYILPGAIDCHCHLGIYSGDYASDLLTETRSAALGGVTTVLNSIITPSFTMKDLDSYISPIGKNAYVDLCLYLVIMTKDHIKELPEYSRVGINSFKFLMAYKGKEGEALGVQGLDLGILYQGFEAVKEAGGLPMVHAENIEVIYGLNPRFQDRNDLAVWSETRPHICEEIDIYSACKIAETVGTPLYVVHTSVGNAIQVVGEFRKRGNTVYLETCPQYLTLEYTGEDIKEPLLGKVNPPLRTKDDIELLWHGIQQGLVNCMGTDHCNPTYQEKMADKNIWNILPGFPGVATLLPIMLSEGVNKGRISIEKVVEVCSLNSAKIHGLYPRKGTLSPGADADLVIVDLDKKVKVTANLLQSRSDFTLYDGWELTGWPILTMVRGTIVSQDMKLVGRQGHGKFIPCTTARACS